MTSPLDDAKLVERLRTWARTQLYDGGGELRSVDDDLLQAADRLSSVLRENERLRARLKVWEPSVVSVTGGQTVSGCEARAALDPIKPDEKGSDDKPKPRAPSDQEFWNG